MTVFDMTQIAAALLLYSAGAAAQENTEPAILFRSDRYLTGNLYVSAPVPPENEPLTIYVEPQVRVHGLARLDGDLTVHDRDGTLVHKRSVVLTPDNGFGVSSEWTPPRNGMYRLQVELRPPPDTGVPGGPFRAELTLPVRTSRREVHFAWYKTDSDPTSWNFLRWATLFTSTDAEQIQPFKRRGLTCLRWITGPMHIGMPADREEWPEKLEQTVREWANYAAENEHGYDGLGLDEFGGYAGTEKHEKTEAFLREMVRQRQALHEGSVIASWAGGGLPLDWVSMHRLTADFLLVELYLFGPFPHGAGTENIYAMIDDRVQALRARDAFTPCWGGTCTALIALDTNHKPDPGNVIPGEFEQVVRYIRRKAPEMRGLAFYNASGVSGPEFARLQRRNRAVADRLCFEYFIKPVVTLQPGSLWLENGDVVVAVSNIGAMDSGAVKVAIYDNDAHLHNLRADSVPAGYSRNDNRRLLRFPWRPDPGLHRLEAHITAAAYSTVLDPVATRDTVVPAPEQQ